MSRLGKFMVVFLVILAVTTEGGCSFSGKSGNGIGNKQAPGNQGDDSKQSAGQTSVGKTQSEGQPDTVTLAAVGDVMGHIPELTAAWDPGRREYDFTPMLAPVKEQIAGADIAVANLETTLAGRSKGYSGFPRFNSPDALAQALKDTGFDLVTTANNHCFDQGEAGTRRTLSVLDKIGLDHTGTFRSSQARQKPLIKTVKGIKIGFAGYTYGTNGLRPPQDKSYLISYAETQAMLQDLKSLRRQGAEVTVILLHFGTEYQRQPAAAQEKLVDDLIAGGADVILGSHPHVPQRVQMRKVTRSGRQSRGLVAFSLGNFLSNQSQPYTDTGMVLEVRLTREAGNNSVRISRVTLNPTWVARFSQGGRNHFEVQPLEALLTSGSRPYLTSSRRKYLQEVLDFFDSIGTGL